MTAPSTPSHGRTVRLQLSSKVSPGDDDAPRPPSAPPGPLLPGPKDSEELIRVLEFTGEASEEPRGKSGGSGSSASLRELGEAVSAPEPVKPRRKQSVGGGLLRTARRRARAVLAPLLSIRTLFVLSAILQVLGAVAVVFCIMWFMTQKNTEELVTALIRNLQHRAYKGVETYLDAATVVADSVARDFEAEHLSRRSWRKVLEAFDQNLDGFPSISFNGVRYNDGYYVGGESCDPVEGGTCATGRRALFGNETHFVTYEAGWRGQPTRHLSTIPILPGAVAWYQAAAASGGSMWFDVRYVATALADGAHPDPLDGMVVSYSSPFREQTSVDEVAPSGGPLPGTPGGTPAAEPATPPSFFSAANATGPIAGVAAVSIRLGALSRRLREAVQVEGTRMVITTSQGRMVATSTCDSRDVLGGTMEPVQAAASPDALTRDLVAQFATGRADETVVFRSGEGEYFGSRAPVRLEPNLDWVLYTAVSRDGVLAELRRARNVAFGVCAAWLVASIVAAGVASWLITRPIDKIKVSMSILLDTMTNVYAELRMHVDPEQTAPLAGELRRRRSRSASKDRSRSGSSSSTASQQQSGIRELTAFDDLVADMHSRFVSFQEVVSAEAKLKIEMEVRSEETKKFLATVSHEMRTPLNGILGMLDLAKECTLPPDAADYVEAASISGEHLLSLVNDILDLQKMEAGLIELSSVPVDVRAAVVSAVRIVKRKADEKGLQVGMDVAEEVPLVLASDPDRLRQVLLNLLSNAVKYTAEGAVEVRVRLPERPATPIASPGRGVGSPRRGAPDRLVVRFEVQDTGAGIAAEHQRSLFQRFYRVQNVSGAGAQSDPGGTGLGLAISREIVEKAGGRIGCSSAPGQGSTFWFELPCGRTVAAPSPAEAAENALALARPSTARPSTSFAQANTTARHSASSTPPGTTDREPGAPAPLRVLVAEDNAMSARVITSMLRREGHAVTLASDGAEAARAFEAALGAAPPGALAFDVVFMDCLMPVCDGYEATGRIRRLEAERGAPRHFVVALTAKAGSEDEAECRAAGMDAFLPKPVRRATLAAYVGGRLGGGGETPAGSPRPAPLDVDASPRGPSLAVPARMNSPEGAAGGGLLGALAPPPPEPPKPRGEPPSQPSPRPAARRPVSQPEMRGGTLEDRLAADVVAAGPKGERPRSPRSVASLTPTPAAASEAPSSPTVPPLDILIVDDVEMNRRVLRTLLAKEGHTVTVACDGQEAAEVFERRAREASADRPVFDLIFMDVSMPVMDGYNATRRIRHVEEGLKGVPPTPVIACTALSSSTDREEMACAGMDDLMVKPVARAVVRTALAKWSRRGRRQSEAAVPSVASLWGSESSGM